jgi:hypothetical protein
MPLQGIVLFALVASTCATGCDAAAGAGAAQSATPVRDTSARPSIALKRSDADDRSRFEVTELSEPVLTALLRSKPTAEQWRRILAVSVAAKPGSESVPMLGDYRVEKQVLVFVPRFPLRAGLTYRAVFDPSALPETVAESTKPVAKRFSIPELPAAAPTVVTHIYPSRDTLPENQLKFYLHFSAPMSRGEAYEHIRLIEGSGMEIEYPFLELGEELWDDTGTRLTLFFDPGRIKRGLKPREEVGPALEEGKSYTLVIGRDWSDARGNPLKQAFRKRFKVVAPDDVQPSPKRWKLTPPQAGTTGPLVARFDEPLDRAMLQRVLVVTDSAGKRVAGSIEVDRDETRWRFRPERPWRAGRYSLVVETTLEDLAGNSIGRPFEVDVFQPIEKRVAPERVSLPFDVAQ